jgi:hypothetical protein
VDGAGSPSLVPARRYGLLCERLSISTSSQALSHITEIATPSNTWA